MRKYKILLIEDSLGDARIFQEFLNEASLGEFEIHQNIRLENALEKLKTIRYDLIVTDLNLPDTFGIETFTTLKEAVENTPIIVFSGNNNIDVAIKAMELGAQDYIIKGRYDKDTLYRTIRFSMERKKYEERLRESEKKFGMVFYESTVPMVIFDSENNSIIEVNKAFGNLSRCQIDKITGINFNDLELFKNASEYNIFLEQLTTSKRVENFEAIFKPVNSEFRIVLVSASNVFINEKECYLLSFTDITERKAADQKLRIYAAQLEEKTVKLLELNNNLKELNLNKDKFYSILSHDLLNPLNALQSFSEMLYTDFDSQALEESKQALSNINQLIRKIINLLKELLLWTGVNTGRIESKPENIHIATLLKGQKEFHQLAALNKNIKLNEEIKDVEICADKVMLETIVRNLISNAIKFTPEGGEVFIRNFIVDNKVTIEIEDSGIGMNDEEVNKLFKIGGNQARPGTRNEKGIGLGLLICKEFVSKNKGTIQVRSEEGSGSIFSITFPETLRSTNE